MVRDSSLSGRLLGLTVHVVVLFIVAITLYPILHIASVSLSGDLHVKSNAVTFYPLDANLRAYELILRDATIPNSFKYAILYTVVGTAVNMVMTVTMAYALSKQRLLFRGLITGLVVVTFFFSGGLIPTYLLVRNLGMYNTIWALVVPVAISVWNLIIMRTFFQSVPQELEDSAFIDGANDITVLVYIVLPVSRAAVAVISLFYAVTHWNSWFPAVVYLKDAERYPLQVMLREIVIFAGLAEALAPRRPLLRGPGRLSRARGDAGHRGPHQVRHPVPVDRADAGAVPVHPALLREGPDDRFAEGLTAPVSPRRRARPARPG